MSVEDNKRSGESDHSLTEEMFAICASASLSEDGIREIIQQHELTPHSNPNVITDYDFFLKACLNASVNVGIIRLLLEYFPAAINARSKTEGSSPLHMACGNKNVKVDIIQLLIDAEPDSVRSVNSRGHMPLHYFCDNSDIDETAAIEILKLLLEKCPESIRHTDDKGRLPIHIASGTGSPEFCRVLIEAHPGSEQIGEGKGALPLHVACAMNSLATVECLYQLYPNAVNHTINGGYPIHFAILSGLAESDRPTAAVDIVRFLLDCDPNVKLQKFHGMSLLCVACFCQYNDSNIDAALQNIKAIYDAHPEAIEIDDFVSCIPRFHQQVQTFIEGELVHARQAKNHRQMTTRYGRLRLHRSLQNNVTLGSIKLLLKGNPSALRNSDNNGALPLHVACEHHDSTKVIQYLIDTDQTTLRCVDLDINTALHYACRGAKYETIALLLERYDALSVSKRNAQMKLPIDLLWESDCVEDRESVEYLDCVFRLMRAHPAMLMSIGMQMRQRGSEVGKKRKFGAV